MLILLLQLCIKQFLIIKMHISMKNSSFKTGQNAVVKRTLSLEEFIMNYTTSSNIQIRDLKIISNDNK